MTRKRDIKVTDFVENWKNQKGFHYKNPCGNLLDACFETELQFKSLHKTEYEKG